MDEEDYYVLLRDTTFIESGTEFSTVLIKVLYLISFAAFVGSIIAFSLFGAEVECVDEEDLAEGDELCLFYELRTNSWMKWTFVGAFGSPF